MKSTYILLYSYKNITGWDIWFLFEGRRGSYSLFQCQKETGRRDVWSSVVGHVRVSQVGVLNPSYVAFYSRGHDGACL